MPKLGSAGNVHNSCLRLLRTRGYQLHAEEISANGDLFWYAEKDGFSFVGDNPIELLGLTAIYEALSPIDAKSAQPYWWVIEGENIYSEIMDAALPYHPSQDGDDS
jgi:hypothetical protein